LEHAKRTAQRHIEAGMEKKKKKKKKKQGRTWWNPGSWVSSTPSSARQA
jgi:hypothetical protein